MLDNSFFRFAYTVTLRPAGFGAGYAVSNLTIAGGSAAAPITLLDRGNLTFSSRLVLSNAVLDMPAQMSGIGSGASAAFNGNATLNVTSKVTMLNGQLTSSGSGNVVNSRAGVVLRNSANFGGAMQWNLAAAFQARFSGLVTSAVTFIASPTRPPTS